MATQRADLANIVAHRAKNVPIASVSSGTAMIAITRFMLQAKTF